MRLSPLVNINMIYFAGSLHCHSRTVLIHISIITSQYRPDYAYHCASSLTNSVTSVTGLLVEFQYFESV